MKKYLFMFLAMFCMAVTSVALTSCGDDDETTGQRWYANASLTIYDPSNQLTAVQKSDLQKKINEVGPFSGIADSEAALLKEYQKWALNVGVMMSEFTDTYPEVEKTDAGLKMNSTSATIPTDLILPFKPVEK